MTKYAFNLMLVKINKKVHLNRVNIKISINIHLDIQKQFCNIYRLNFFELIMKHYNEITYNEKLVMRHLHFINILL